MPPGICVIWVPVVRGAQTCALMRQLFTGPMQHRGPGVVDWGVH